MTKEKTAKASTTLIAYKAFDKDFRCRDFQYEVGKTYTHDGPVELCRGGFHACEHPFDIWSYYQLGDSRYAEVELGGVTDERGGDTKRVGSSITIKAEVDIAGLVKAAVEWTHAKTPPASGAYSNLAASGAYSKLAASGAYSNLAASGEGGTITAAAYGCSAKAGPGGCIALAWHDGKRSRIAVGYVGEGIDADTWYRVDNGALVQA